MCLSIARTSPPSLDLIVFVIAAVVGARCGISTVPGQVRQSVCDSARVPHTAFRRRVGIHRPSPARTANETASRKP